MWKWITLQNNSYHSSTTNQAVLKESGYAFFCYLKTIYLLKLYIFFNIGSINIF